MIGTVHSNDIFEKKKTAQQHFCSIALKSDLVSKCMLICSRAINKR